MMQSPNTGPGRNLSKEARDQEAMLDSSVWGNLPKRRKGFLDYLGSFPAYEYENIAFEYCRSKPGSPWPLKKNGEPRAHACVKFHKMIDRFLALSEADQDKCRVA